MSNIHVTAKVNGDDVEFLCDPRETLLDVLRDRLNLTGTKEGCGTGDCGACTVTIEGRLVCSCLMLGVEPHPLVQKMGLGFKQDLNTKVANYGKNQATALEVMLAAKWK